MIRVPLGQLGAAARAVRWLLPVELGPGALRRLRSGARRRRRRQPSPPRSSGSLVAERPVDQYLDEARQLLDRRRLAAAGRRLRGSRRRSRGRSGRGPRRSAGERSKLCRIITSNASEPRSRCATPAVPRVSDSTVVSIAASGSLTTSSMNTVRAATSLSRKSPSLAVGGADPFGDLGDDLVEGREEALLLALEVLVEGRLRDPGQPHQLAQRRPGVAVAGHRLDHRRLEPGLLVAGDAVGRQAPHPPAAGGKSGRSPAELRSEGAIPAEKIETRRSSLHVLKLTEPCTMP